MDTITKQCDVCGEDFDFLPNAGMKCICEECPEYDLTEDETYTPVINKDYEEENDVTDNSADDSES